MLSYQIKSKPWTRTVVAAISWGTTGQKSWSQKEWLFLRLSASLPVSLLCVDSGGGRSSREILISMGKAWQIPRLLDSAGLPLLVPAGHQGQITLNSQIQRVDLEPFQTCPVIFRKYCEENGWFLKLSKKLKCKWCIYAAFTFSPWLLSQMILCSLSKRNKNHLVCFFICSPYHLWSQMRCY